MGQEPPVPIEHQCTKLRAAGAGLNTFRGCAAHHWREMLQAQMMLPCCTADCAGSQFASEADLPANVCSGAHAKYTSERELRDGADAGIRTQIDPL
jgi:hypothetical protein